MADFREITILSAGPIKLYRTLINLDEIVGIRSYVIPPNSFMTTYTDLKAEIVNRTGRNLALITLTNRASAWLVMRHIDPSNGTFSNETDYGGHESRRREDTATAILAGNITSPLAACEYAFATLSRPEEFINSRQPEPGAMLG